MPFDIVTIPCLSDNYAFVAHDPETGATAVVDVPEARPIMAVLDERGWELSHVLLTHHHMDHVAGLSELLQGRKAIVVGAHDDQDRLPPLDMALKEGDTITIGSQTGKVIDVSGHTVGHIAFHFADTQAAFTGDSLMACGCGRVFEGTMAQMYQSLCKLADLPKTTVIYSGHEYTNANATFALSVDPNNATLHDRKAQIERDRAAGRATVPSLLSLELETNPFLRAFDANIQETLGMVGEDFEAVFAEIRQRKDSF